MIADRFTMALLLSVMNCQRGIKAIATTVLNSVLGDLDANCQPFSQAGQTAIQGFGSVSYTHLTLPTIAKV